MTASQLILRARRVKIRRVTQAAPLQRYEIDPFHLLYQSSLRFRMQLAAQAAEADAAARAASELSARQADSAG